MDETANATAQSAADDKVYARLEKDLTAVKNDVAHLSQQISEAVNAHGAVANAAHHAASLVGDTPAGVIQERTVATRAFVSGPARGRQLIGKGARR